MPTILKTKNSVTTTVVPTTLQQGELAVNITDKKVWVGNAATTPVQLLGDGGSASFTSIAFGAGTVSAPSITFTGDTNTGIYSPAADTIAFTEGGVESMRITSAGDVVVGGTAALNSSAGRGNITINGSSSSILNLGTGGTVKGYVFHTGTDMTLQNDVNGFLNFVTNGTERMRIDSSGNVGIGTSTTTDAGVTITTSVSRDSGWNAKLGLQSTGTNNYPTLLFSGCSSASRYGAIIQTTNTSGNSPTNITAGIIFENTSSTAGNIVFTTNGNIGTTSSTEAMRISSGQQVGIGKSPAVTLDVNGAINYDPNVTVNGLSVVSRATYNDGVNRALGASWNNCFGIITIKGTGGATNIPFFSNGGGGVAFQCTTLDPDAGTWSYGGPTITFTTAGTGGNTFVLAFLSGSGSFELQRTAGSGSFTVVIQHYTT
jgi:hypothetical protein